MIKFLIVLTLLIAIITILLVLALCKTAKKSDENAQIILKKYPTKTKKIDNLDNM